MLWLRLVLLVSAIATGTVLVRHVTDMLEGRPIVAASRIAP